MNLTLVSLPRMNAAFQAHPSPPFPLARTDANVM